MAKEKKEKVILLVEDDESTAVILCKQLEQAGYKITHVFDGLYALQWLEDNMPDLIIIDKIMPRLDGFKLLKAIRFLGEHYDRELSRVPKMLISANNDTGTMIGAINLGCKFILPKPVKPEELKSKVKKALERKFG